MIRSDGTTRPTAAVLGATGLVGGHLVRVLAQASGGPRVRAVVRRDAESIRGLGVEVRVVDFGDGAAMADAVACDQLFVCLGTTRRRSGSREAFRRVDFDLVVDAARAAVLRGAQDLFLVSSVGADAASRSFYLRVKGEAEQALGVLGARSLHVFRPSILTGARRELRPGEQAAILLATLATPLLRGSTRRYRPISAQTVARAMARVASAPAPGRHVHESEEIAALGA